MSHAKVRAALASAFIGGGFFASSAIQWPNIKFNQPASGPWAAFFFLPAQPEVASLGTAGLDEMNGLIQIDLNYALNSGEGEAEAKAKAIRDLFKAGAYFTYDGQTVTIRSCGNAPGRPVDGFFRVSMSIFFYAYLTRG